jgi:hypothetical protein
MVTNITEKNLHLHYYIYMNTRHEYFLHSLPQKTGGQEFSLYTKLKNPLTPPSKY